MEVSPLQADTDSTVIILLMQPNNPNYPTAHPLHIVSEQHSESRCSI
jgi:hypothetical protein